MGRITAILLLLAPALLAAQVRTETLPVAPARAEGFSGSGGTYTGVLGGIYRVAPYAYNVDSIKVGHKFLDAAGRVYDLDAVGTPFADRVAVTLSSAYTVQHLPSGRGLVFRPDTFGLIPHLPPDNGLITRHLAGKIYQHNLKVLRRRVARLDSVVVNLPAGGGGSATDSFNMNQPILRVPTVGTVIGGYTWVDHISWHYFAPPTISVIGSSHTVEVGTITTWQYVFNTSNPGVATLSNGRVLIGGQQVVGYGDATSQTYQLTFQPGAASGFNALVYSVQARQDWVKGGESGTASSSSRTVRGVYPVLFGVSNTDLSQGGDAYTVLTKLIETEGNKTVTFDGSGFLYFAIPNTWSDTNLSSIKDANNFEVLGSFTRYPITVNSSGLNNNWTRTYYLYKLNNLTTANNAQYQFIR